VDLLIPHQFDPEVPASFLIFSVSALTISMSFACNFVCAEGSMRRSPPRTSPMIRTSAFEKSPISRSRLPARLDFSDTFTSVM
jgi:hypothetical protein